MLVNDELNELKKGLVTSENILACGGTLCVVSFHSKEDKLVKNFLNICQGKTKSFISKFLFLVEKFKLILPSSPLIIL